MKHLTHIEPLEDRIAPATIVNPYTVTFQDTDGDTAIVHISKPLFKNPAAAGKILNFSTNDGSTETFGGNAVAESLTEINLLGRTGAQGLDISVKVIPQVGIGNMQVNVGTIDAGTFSNFQASGNIDLGHIYIQGNLGSITAGDNISTTAIQSLTVESMVPMYQLTQSTVLGPIQKMDVKGDFTTNLSMIGYQFGSIGKLTIGGTLGADEIGDNVSGLIQFSGHISSATIGSITGGAGDDTGELLGTSTNASYIGSLHVIDSITGGAGQDSGRVFAQSSLEKITVSGSLVGGAGQDSGEIAGPIKNLNIVGAIQGSSGTDSGSVIGEAANGQQNAIFVGIGKVVVGGSVTGGTAGTAASGSTSSTPGDSGVIEAASARSISIGGSLVGGNAVVNNSSQAAIASGAVIVNSLHSLAIQGSVTGGSGENSGLITGLGGLSVMSYGSVVIDGGVTGGSGASSGSILINTLLGGSLGSLHIGGNLTGGSATQTGEVQTTTGLGTLYIGGNVTGGTADNTGEILAGGALTSATIKGNLAGNTSINSTTAVVGSGYIQAGSIGSLAISGNVTSGANSGGKIANSGAIRSAANILSLAIGGQVTGTAANPVFISATEGPATSGKPKSDLAIKSVTVGQAAAYLDLLAGYSPTVSTTTGGVTDPAGAPLGTATDGTAQIGTVLFKGDLSASNVVAGVKPGSSGFFGTSADTAIAAQSGKENLISSIASIIVDGSASGNSTPADSFGFVAQEVVKVTVDGASVKLTPGPDNDHLVAVSGNLVVNEVPPA